MKLRTKVIATTLAFTIVGLMLGPQTPLGEALWGAPAGMDGAGPPPGWAIGAMVGVGLVQALAFGAGVAFLLFGRPFLARLGGPPRLATAAHLTVAWSLLSWVPHSAMHMTAGPNMGKLVLTEYLFHVTLIAGAALLALYLVRAAQARPAAMVMPRPAAAAQVLAAQPAARPGATPAAGRVTLRPVAPPGGQPPGAR